MTYSRDHSADHQPVNDHAECAVCNEALRRTFNEIADLELGPNGVDVLMTAIRDIASVYAERIARGYVVRGAS